VPEPTAIAVVRSLCAAAASAMRRHRAVRAAPRAPASSGTLRRVGTGTSVATPSSDAFCTTQSIFSPFSTAW